MPNLGIKQGFTLIELLVVIAIIGVLASVVLATLTSARAKSRDAKRIGDVRQVMTALELFYNDNNRYPTATTNVPTSSDGAPAFSTHLASYPTAPTPFDNPAVGGTCTAVNNAYVYAQTGSGTGYTITFCLGGLTGRLQPGLHTATPGAIN